MFRKKWKENHHNKFYFLIIILFRKNLNVNNCLPETKIEVSSENKTRDSLLIISICGRIYVWPFVTTNIGSLWLQINYLWLYIYIYLLLIYHHQWQLYPGSSCWWWYIIYKHSHWDDICCLGMPNLAVDEHSLTGRVNGGGMICSAKFDLLTFFFFFPVFVTHWQSQR